MKVTQLLWQVPALLIALIVGGVTGCGSGSSGQASVAVADASSDQYNAIYVTIDKIQVHASADAEESGWVTLFTPRKTINLLSLINGVREELGVVSLAAGHYTQMRLVIGSEADTGINTLSQSHPFANYVIDTSNAYHELKVPSGHQTGVKIVQGFDINANETTELILDFNAAASVVIAGSSGNYLLKPTIKVLETADYAILSGRVTAAADGSAIAGALVTAQTYNASAADLKDQVTVESGTISADTGFYALFLAPSTYNAVAFKVGFTPSASATTLAAGTTTTLDFSLTAASSGTATGSVTISGAGSETFATLSFRQDATVSGSASVIEVASLNVASGGTYSLSLPVGTYTVISSSAGQTTQSATLVITASASTTLNVSF